MAEKKFFLEIFFNKFARKISCNMRISNRVNYVSTINHSRKT